MYMYVCLDEKFVLPPQVGFCQVFAFYGECVPEDRRGLVLILQGPGSIMPCMSTPPRRAVSLSSVQLLGRV